MPTDAIEVLNALLKSEDDVTFHCGDHNITDVLDGDNTIDPEYE